jgi:hypothetical protein
LNRNESPKTSPAKPLATKKKSCWLLILNDKPDKVMITIKITEAIIILMMFSCSDPILREASVNAIEVPDQRKAVRSAINSPYKI